MKNLNRVKAFVFLNTAIVGVGVGAALSPAPAEACFNMSAPGSCSSHCWSSGSSGSYWCSWYFYGGCDGDPNGPSCP
jgi:hypothetical protein